VARAGVQKSLAAARAQELKNDQLLAKIELEKQLPLLMQYALQQGHSIKYGKDGLEVHNAVRVSELPNQGQLSGGALGALSGPSGGDLPTNVLYQDIRGQVPQGHV